MASRWKLKIVVEKTTRDAHWLGNREGPRIGEYKIFYPYEIIKLDTKVWIYREKKPSKRYPNGGRNERLRREERKPLARHCIPFNRYAIECICSKRNSVARGIHFDCPNYKAWIKSRKGN